MAITAAPPPRVRRSGSIITVLVALAVLAGSIWFSEIGPAADSATQAATAGSPVADLSREDYALRHAPVALAETGPYQDYALRHAPVVAPQLDLGDDYATRHMPVALSEADRRQDYALRHMSR